MAGFSFQLSDEQHCLVYSPKKVNAMLQTTLFVRFECLRCHKPARLNKFYRLCYKCCKECAANPKERKLWFYGNRDVDEDATTNAPPLSRDKIRVMRKRLLSGLALFNDGDNKIVDWSKVSVQSLYQEPQQRWSGQTGVERDGVNFRARPMAGGVKHNLGEFKEEWEAVWVVEWFWRNWLGLPEDATQEEIDDARAKDASGARIGARVKRQKRKFQEAAEEETPLFGAALQYA